MRIRFTVSRKITLFVASSLVAIMMASALNIKAQSGWDATFSPDCAAVAISHPAGLTGNLLVYINQQYPIGLNIQAGDKPIVVLLTNVGGTVPAQVSYSFNAAAAIALGYCRAISPGAPVFATLSAKVLPPPSRAN